MSRENNTWIFSGSDNASGKYIRTITISNVNRDGNGDIDENSGDVDVDTKKVTVVVSWNVASSRHNSVVLDTFLTNWK